METQVSRPRVQHHRHPQCGSESTLTELQQCLAGAPKQCFEEHSGPSAAQRTQLARQREDDMEVPYGQQPLGARSNPALLRQALTLWTVPIAAGVVCGLLMPARAAHLDMPAEGGRAALRDRSEHTPLRYTEPVLGFELGPVLSDDLGDVEAGPPGGCRAVAHFELSRSCATGPTGSSSSTTTPCSPERSASSS
jgi:hypothetical protein